MTLNRSCWYLFRYRVIELLEKREFYEKEYDKFKLWYEENFEEYKEDKLEEFWLEWDYTIRYLDWQYELINREDIRYFFNILMQYYYGVWTRMQRKKYKSYYFRFYVKRFKWPIIKFFKYSKLWIPVLILAIRTHHRLYFHKFYYRTTYFNLLVWFCFSKYRVLLLRFINDYYSPIYFFCKDELFFFWNHLIILFDGYLSLFLILLEQKIMHLLYFILFYLCCELYLLFYFFI